MNDTIPTIPNTTGKYTNSIIIIESIILSNKYHALSYKYSIWIHVKSIHILPAKIFLSISIFIPHRIYIFHISPFPNSY